MTDEKQSWYGGGIYPLDADGNLIDEEPDARIGKPKRGWPIILWPIILCVVLMVAAAVAIVGKLSGLF